MGLLRKIIYYLVVVVSTLVILAMLASLAHDIVLWYAKILDFPRTQYLIAAAVCLLLFAVLNRKWKLPAWALVSGLIATVVVQSLFIAPYLTGSPAVPAADSAAVTADNSASILIANVLISNREANEFLALVNDRDPDLVLAMEVNDWWIGQLRPLEREYPYQMQYPADNAYGMALYSRLPFSDQETMILAHDSVPSFHATVDLPGGKNFTFHGVHPVAPVPSDEYVDGTGDREVALLKVADMVANASAPAIVAGDFNDVSWSNTTRLFGERTHLGNVRLGRGLYNSFSAHSPILRWPLDHYFVSPEFQVAELERLPAFGSDHFPVYARFVLP